MIEGPAPKLIEAMTLSGTEPPLAVGTGMFSIVDRLRREPSVRATRIGTCRSDREKRALAWSVSARVATRIACLVAQGTRARHLPIGQGEAGAGLVDLALRGDADRLAHGGSGDTHVGHQVEPRRDRDLGTAQIAGDARRAQFRPLAHLLDQLERCALELGRVGAG